MHKKFIKAPIFKRGVIHHPQLGILNMTDKVAQELKDNFEKGTLGHTPYITFGHESLQKEFEKESIDANLNKGNIIKIEDDGVYLYGLIDVKEDTYDYVKNGEFTYISPEYETDFLDKYSGQRKGATLMRVALTNSPYTPDLKKVIALSQSAKDKDSRIISLSMGLGENKIQLIEEINQSSMAENIKEQTKNKTVKSKKVKDEIDGAEKEEEVTAEVDKENKENKKVFIETEEKVLVSDVSSSDTTSGNEIELVNIKEVTSQVNNSNSDTTVIKSEDTTVVEDTTDEKEAAEKTVEKTESRVEESKEETETEVKTEIKEVNKSVSSVPSISSTEESSINNNNSKTTVGSDLNPEVESNKGLTSNTDNEVTNVNMESNITPQVSESDAIDTGLPLPKSESNEGVKVSFGERMDLEGQSSLEEGLDINAFTSSIQKTYTDLSEMERESNSTEIILLKQRLAKIEEREKELKEQLESEKQRVALTQSALRNNQNEIVLKSLRVNGINENHITSFKIIQEALNQGSRVIKLSQNGGEVVKLDVGKAIADLVISVAKSATVNLSQTGMPSRASYLPSSYNAGSTIDPTVIRGIIAKNLERQKQRGS